MEVVTKEVRRPWTWYYKDGSYIRLDEKGNMTGNIMGLHLPDPLDIKRKLLEADKRGQNTSGMLDADPVVYELWKDWQKRKVVH